MLGRALNRSLAARPLLSRSGSSPSGGGEGRGKLLPSAPAPLPQRRRLPACLPWSGLERRRKMLLGRQPPPLQRPGGWDRCRISERLQAALAGLQELQVLREKQRALVSGALTMQPASQAQSKEQRLEATLTALKEQLVRGDPLLQTGAGEALLGSPEATPDRWSQLHFGNRGGDPTCPGDTAVSCLLRRPCVPPFLHTDYPVPLPIHLFRSF